MENISIVLCDSDEAYVRRLAAALHAYLDPGIFIRTKPAPAETEAGDSLSVCILGGEEGGTESVLWEAQIFKYQPVAAIAGRIRQQFPQERRRRLYVRTASLQVWYGVISPCRHESAVPFLCTLAGVLGEKKKVLAVLFTQLSGIGRLLELSASCDTEGFYLQLRRSGEDAACRAALPQPVALPGFDLLTEPRNPSVLFELRGEELHLLTLALLGSGYDAVVWMADSAFSGMEHLIRQSRYVFSLEKSDTASVCRQEAFDAFGRKLAGDAWEEKVRRLRLPVFAQMECGEHLLWQWKESMLREEALKWTEEETIYAD